MLIFMLMLTISKSQRAPHPHILLFMLLLTIDLYYDGEHAWNILMLELF
jgi:hypothetical protein